MFYAQPWVDMHNRMKEALVLLGKLPRAVVRPPLVKIERAEIERIRKALVEAKLLQRGEREGGVATGSGLSPPPCGEGRARSARGGVCFTTSLSPPDLARLSPPRHPPHKGKGDS